MRPIRTHVDRVLALLRRGYPADRFGRAALAAPSDWLRPDDSGPGLRLGPAHCHPPWPSSAPAAAPRRADGVGRSRTWPPTARTRPARTSGPRTPKASVVNGCTAAVATPTTISTPSDPSSDRWTRPGGDSGQEEQPTQPDEVGAAPVDRHRVGPEEQADADEEQDPRTATPTPSEGVGGDRGGHRTDREDDVPAHEARTMAPSGGGSSSGAAGSSRRPRVGHRRQPHTAARASASRPASFSYENSVSTRRRAAAAMRTRRSGRRAARPWPSHRRRRTWIADHRPGHARRPPPRGRHHWPRPPAATPVAAASRNTMPKPSCSSPATGRRHTIAKTSACAVQHRPGPTSGTRPRKRTGRGRPGQPLEPTAVPSGTGQGQHHVRVARRQLGHRPDEHVDPLARHQPAQAEHHLGRRGQPQAGPGRGPAGGVEGVEPLHVDAGRDHHVGSGPTRGPGGFGRRVAAGARPPAGPAQDRSQRLARSRGPVPAPDLGPVHHDAVGPFRAARPGPSGRAGSSRTSWRRPRRPAARSGATRPGVGSSTGGAARSIRNPWRVSQPAGPVRRRSARSARRGSRRQSSQR